MHFYKQYESTRALLYVGVTYFCVICFVPATQLLRTQQNINDVPSVHSHCLRGSVSLCIYFQTLATCII